LQLDQAAAIVSQRLGLNLECRARREKLGFADILLDGRFLGRVYGNISGDCVFQMIISAQELAALPED
jgi:hypothetical protein